MRNTHPPDSVEWKLFDIAEGLDADAYKWEHQTRDLLKMAANARSKADKYRMSLAKLKGKRRR